MYVYWFLCVLVYYASNSELTSFIFHILSIIAEKFTHIDSLTLTQTHTHTHTHTCTHTHTHTLRVPLRLLLQLLALRSKR